MCKNIALDFPLFPYMHSFHLLRICDLRVPRVTYIYSHFSPIFGIFMLHYIERGGGMPCSLRKYFLGRTVTATMTGGLVDIHISHVAFVNKGNERYECTNKEMSASYIII